MNDADGNSVYDNRGVIIGNVSWGKIRSYEVFEDTQKVEALDTYLDSQSTGAKSSHAP